MTKNGRPSTYASWIHSSVDWSYPITERDCLAIVWALQKFRI